MFQLIEFRKLNTSIENVEVPARPENRSVTDKTGFLIFGISILILVRDFRVPSFGAKIVVSDTFLSLHLGQRGF